MFIFYHFTMLALHEPLVRMMKNYVFDYFEVFFIVFGHGLKTQHLISLKSLSLNLLDNLDNLDGLKLKHLKI